MDKWMIGNSSIDIMDLIRLSQNVRRCVPSILFAFHLSAPYHIQKKRTIDAITSDNPPRHFGTLKDTDAPAHIRSDAACRRYGPGFAIWPSTIATINSNNHCPLFKTSCFGILEGLSFTVKCHSFHTKTTCFGVVEAVAYRSFPTCLSLKGRLLMARASRAYRSCPSSLLLVGRLLTPRDLLAYFLCRVCLYDR